MRRSPVLALVLVAVLPLVWLLGVWAGGHPDRLPGPLRDAFVADDVNHLQTALDTIQDEYYRPLKRSQLVDSSINGAVERLGDRFSHYFNAKDYRRFRESTDGRYAGIGVEVVEVPQGLRIARVIAGAPAQKAGFKANDIIVAVNGHSIAGSASARASSEIRGKPGTPVRLTVATGSRRRTVSVTRATVADDVVSSSLRAVGPTRVGVIALDSFTSGAHGEVRQAVDGLLKRGAKALVLDLRGNGGGLLDEAVLVSSIFVKEGTIVTTRGRSRPEHVFRASGHAISGSIPVVVLVDRNSASASEIVTGALQDRKRAKVVGTRTFGKGVFQSVLELPNGGALDITVGEYFLPSGRNIGGGGVRQGKGIAPDVPAEDNPRTRPDEGLDRALSVVAGELG